MHQLLKIESAANALLAHIMTLEDDAIRALPSDFFDYADDAHFTTDLFDLLSDPQRVSYIDLISPFSFQLCRAAKRHEKSDEAIAKAELYCQSVFNALLNFEISQLED